jgi:3-methylfumaryl-CoA hydratase
VASTTDKVGASGLLTFVVVRHVIEQDGRVVVEEEQDLVYREEAVERTGETTAPDATTTTDGAWEVPVDPVLLFRFSALTYNAHRIHYDRDYSRDVERYPGLVVHGPLQALAMAECARRSGARGRLEMSYRLVSPLFDGQGMFADVETGPGGWSTRIADRGGRTTARGVVSTIPSA